MELPASFTARMCTLLGESEAERFFEALAAEPPVSIRRNPLKPFAALADTTPVPWCREGCYLPARPSFTFDTLFHAGCYYVQEASSMFLEQALRHLTHPDVPVAMLDLCAAPGGKSTHARSLLPEGSLLVANEVMRGRSQILAENLTKWGHPGVVVTSNDPADFAPLAHFFDLILVDAPCSGEGMFRKDPVAVSEWSDDNVDLCWKRQRRILADVWGTLKPGGHLIYSTCTYNTAEDEENVRWMREEWGAAVVTLPTSPEWGVKGNLFPGEDFAVYRFMPHVTRGEGIFMAVLQKPAAESPAEGGVLPRETMEHPREKKSKKTKAAAARGTKAQQPVLTKEQAAALRCWLADADAYELIVERERVRAFPKEWLAGLDLIRQHLHLLQAGIELAELRGRDWLPCHALAMSTALRPGAFHAAELSYEQSIAYLRKEAIALPADAPRGIVMLTYQGHPLGFAKNVGNRANNLYPQEWRIRASL